MRKLSESIWSNINKRSEGDILRKEDDIDFMDIKSFCEYLKTVYKCRGDRSITYYTFHYEGHGEGRDTLVVSLYEDRHGYLTYIYYDGIYIDTQLIVLKELKCVDEFNDKFSTKITQGDHEVENVEIFPKDKNTNITNRFFLKVLDFLLDKIEYPLIPDIEKMNNLKESIWSNINKRSEGNLDRKEDNTDGMNRDEFWDYLKCHYKTKFMNINKMDMYPDEMDVIYVPVLHPENGGYFNLCIGFEDNRCIYIPNGIKKYFAELYSKMYQDFSFKPGEGVSYITPKNSDEITNTFFLKLIDYIIDNTENKDELIIEKK